MRWRRTAKYLLAWWPWSWSFGDYDAKVTEVTHGTYTWNSSLDVDNPAYYTLQ